MEEDRAGTGLNNPSSHRIGLLCCLLLSLPWARGAIAATQHFELEAGDARINLTEFSRQADLQLLYDFRELKGLNTQAVSGDMEPVDALRAMLRGTPLEWSFVNSRTLAITVIKPTPPQQRHWWQRPQRASQTPENTSLDQVVIAGSSALNEPAAVGASLIRLDRADINDSGLTSAQDVLRTLPEVFGGGPSEDTVRGREALTNTSKGSGVNLRGLDAGATLVLIDGQRIAPSGGEGLFSDVANIPLSAIDHIDVLPDGASAKYGADAIGGVVNFVLRSNFSGAETQLADGSFPGNSLGARQVSQLLGTSWDSGSAMVGAEYYGRRALPSSDRAQATSDLRPFGGTNFDQLYGSGPGTLFIGSQSWALPARQSGQALTAGELTAGTQNLYDQWTGVNVLPEQQRWSAFGTLRQTVSDGLELFADTLFTDRKVTHEETAGSPLIATVTPANPFYLNPTGGTGPVTVVAGSEAFFGVPTDADEIRSGNANVGLRWQPFSAWTVTGHLAYTYENEELREGGLVDAASLAAALEDSSAATAFDPFGTAANNDLTTLAGIARIGLFDKRSNLTTAAVSADGVLAHLPGGDMRIAAGAEYRYQQFDTLEATVDASGQADAGSITRESLRRKVRSEFAEVRVPLFGMDNARRFLRQLELSVGGRSEDYSDVGHAAVPKFGVLWSPLPGVSLRGTWSKAFRPPALTDVPTTNSFNEVIALPDSTAAHGSTTALVAYGTNPNLREERARTWTLGVAWTPEPVPKLSVGLTYFDTYYAERIASTQLAQQVLNQPSFAYLVSRSFTPAQRAAICDQTVSLGSPGDCLDADIGAIVDARLRNVDLLETQGIDLIGKYAFSSAVGDFGLGINGTYLLKYAEQQTPDSAMTNLLNTQTNPINLRFRNSLSWELAGFGASAYANFSNGYRDVLSVPNRNVRSWTTFDLQFRYRASGDVAEPLTGMEFAISALNVFNRSAPFLNNSIGLGYDQENADLTGRIFSLSVRKRW